MQQHSAATGPKVKPQAGQEMAGALWVPVCPPECICRGGGL